jgi:CDGSH-type Zn-finger protein
LRRPEEPSGHVEESARLPKDGVIITPYRDGPLLVRGPIRLTTPDGTPIASDRDPVALCRCGRSRMKPFCDGTHKLVGFRAGNGV